MTGGEPEIGDKVSWNYGSGAPGGTIAEKKTEGEIAIKSKRGNTIKKNASIDNPAVHIERSGNDVVKRVSELNPVEKKASSSKSNGKKREAEHDAEEPTAENADGKEVSKTGKKQKTAAPKKDEKKGEKAEDKKEEAAEAKKEEAAEAKEEEKKDETQDEKKKAGPPKKAEGGAASKKKKKIPTPRSTEGIGSRTRSRN